MVGRALGEWRAAAAIAAFGMTSVLTDRRRADSAPPTRSSRVPLPPLSGRLQLVRACLLSVLVLSASLVIELIVVSGFTERAAQAQALASLRADLAAGTAPLGPLDVKGHPLHPAAPVVYLEIPSIHLKQVIGEGTTSGDLLKGPGHRRDTPLPGQAGVSIILGREGAFGGPFGDIDRLRKGATIRVTTGQGRFVYQVLRVRHEGDPVPPALKAGAGRLLLATSAGSLFVPSGVLRVDADLTTTALPGPARLVSSQSLPSSEQLMGTDSSTLWALALWLQALIAAALGSLWAWHRWGRAQTWIVFLPLLLLLGLAAAEEAARLLPNLL